MLKKKLDILNKQIKKLEEPKKSPVKKEEPKKEALKKEELKKQFSLDFWNALTQAQKVIKFYEENKGIFSKDKYLVRNKKVLDEKIQTINKFLNDPKCNKIKSNPPFVPTLKKALSLYEQSHLKAKKKEESKNLPVLTMDKMKELIGEDKLTALKKILINTTNIKYKALYILSMMRGFLPPTYSEELIDKYGVEGMFKVYETFLKTHSNKLVNFPERKGQMEKIMPKSLYNKIYNALPYEILNGKKYMTQEEYMNR